MLRAKCVTYLYTIISAKQHTMNREVIQQKGQRLRAFYESGATRAWAFRKQQLQLLKNSILKYEQSLYDALYSDLKKSAEESWVTELGIVMTEIIIAHFRIFAGQQENSGPHSRTKTGSMLFHQPSIL